MGEHVPYRHEGLHHAAFFFVIDCEKPTLHYFVSFLEFPLREFRRETLNIFGEKLVVSCNLAPELVIIVQNLTSFEPFQLFLRPEEQVVRKVWVDGCNVSRPRGFRVFLLFHEMYCKWHDHLRFELI